MIQLTDAQKRAVQSWERGDICVIAGPGSGKTRVLVERLRWLVLERSVDPERILAITFTEKAAKEMQARVVGGAGESRDRLGAVQVSTIDAFCNRLLREHALLAGLDPGFEMLDEEEASEMLESAVAEALDWEFRRRDPALDEFLSAYVSGYGMRPRDQFGAVHRDIAQLARQVRSHGRRPFRSRGRGPWRQLTRALEQLARVRASPELAAAAASLSRALPADPERLGPLAAQVEGLVKRYRKQGKAKDLVAQIKDWLLPACKGSVTAAQHAVARAWMHRTLLRALRNFATAKRSASRMDFDDALEKAARLLVSQSAPPLAYEHILIDEFQDTNPLQIRLVERLLDAHGPRRPVRFVAGDINQSIYGFRHAVREVFQAYRQRVELEGGEVVQLRDNFRSRPEILAAVHRILPGGRSSGIEEHSLRAAGEFPPKRQPCVEFLVAAGAGSDPIRTEARGLAGRLGALRASMRAADRANPGATRAMRWSDMAVLARTHATAGAIAAEFRLQGLPCATAVTRGLFDAPVTLELAAYLRAVRNPRDEVSLAAVLKSPFCGISDSALLQLRISSENLADALSPSADTSHLSPADASRFGRFKAAFLRCRDDREAVPARQLLARAVADCGYRSILSKAFDGDQAREQVDQLLDWLGRQHLRGRHSLSDVSAALEAAMRDKPPVKAAPDSNSAEAVQVLTMHAAKGLEFPVVALAAVNRSVARRTPGMLYSERFGVGARWAAAGQGKQADLAYVQTRAAAALRETQEEDRLLYVAMTRAEEHLILSSSFPKAPPRKRTGWFGAVCDGLGVDPLGKATDGLRERSAEGVRFLYGKTVGPLADATPAVPVPETASREVLLPKEPGSHADYVAAVTSVALFAECPRKFYLSRYLGLGSQGSSSDGQRAGQPSSGRGKRRQQLDPSEFGTKVHEYLAGETAGATPAVRTLAKKFERHDLGRRAAAAWRVDKEAAYVFTIGGHVLRGTIDLLFEDGDGRVLVDYKTDRRPRSRLRQAALEHAIQLQLYAAGLQDAGHAVDRAVVFYLRHGEGVDIDISDGAIATAREQVEMLFRAQGRQQFPLREGVHCRNCPHFLGSCPAVGETGSSSAGPAVSSQSDGSRLDSEVSAE